jgi:hypothetical protein
MMNGAASDGHKLVTHLDFGGFSRKLVIMNRWFPRQFLVAVLALLIALGLGLPQVQASVMPEHMAMMQGMDTTMKNCPDCDKMDKQTGMQESCGLICAAPALPALSSPDGLKLSLRPARFPLERASLLHGMTSPPEPPPPRSLSVV